MSRLLPVAELTPSRPPHCGAPAWIPQAARLAQLPQAEQYAAVELFRGTMVRHSAVVYRNDSPGGPERVRFAGDAWLSYVPIRMSDTICVQERLPPGAAAVLINQSHTFKDLVLPVDLTEKGLFDLIDGNCSIGDIVDNGCHLPTNRSSTRPAASLNGSGGMIKWSSTLRGNPGECRARENPE